MKKKLRFYVDGVVYLDVLALSFPLTEGNFVRYAIRHEAFSPFCLNLIFFGREYYNFVRMCVRNFPTHVCMCVEHHDCFSSFSLSFDSFVSRQKRNAVRAGKKHANGVSCPMANTHVDSIPDSGMDWFANPARYTRCAVSRAAHEEEHR